MRPASSPDRMSTSMGRGKTSSSLAVAECDSLDVHVLLDNTTDLTSTAGPMVTSHLGNALRRRPRFGLTGTCLCCANWGLSLALDIRTGSVTRRVMFDAGPDCESLRRNARILGYDLTQFDAVVLSHGHWDHAGGLTEPFSQQKRRATPRVTEFHANRSMFVRRGMRTAPDRVVPFKTPPSPESLGRLGAKLILEDGARVLAGGCAYLSGEIPRLTEYEVGLPGHVSMDSKSSEWMEDPLILDERWLAVKVRGRGVVVFSACSHAGVINVLRHAKTVFADTPLYAVMGGLHLSGQPNEQIIDRTVEDLAVFSLARIIPGHCTGWRAINALEQRFGDQVTPLSVGQTHRFEGIG